LKVLMYTHYFYPEHLAALSKRTGDLARALVRDGHEVTVVTAFPSYPTGRVYPGYEGERFREEEWEEGIRLVRCWSYIRPFERGRTRILNQLSLMGSALTQGTWALRGRKADVVFGISPPLFIALAGLLVAKARRVPYVMDVQDLWPEEAVAVGGLRSRYAVRLAAALARFLYRNSARVVVISEGFRRAIVGQGASKRAVEVLPNWVWPGSFVEAEPTDLPGSGCRVVFAGTIGMAQGLSVVLSAAERLRERDVSFVLVGEGVEKERLRSEALERGLSNVHFAPAVRQDRIPGVLAAADALLVHLRPAEVFGSVIPSKTYEYLAAGRPILMGVPGDAARLVEEAEAGVVFPSGDPDALAGAVEEVMGLDEEERRAVGERGREYARRNFTVEALTARYVQILREAAGGAP
jgi:glycosyltransferase involved in cell wall biosynthesis